MALSGDISATFVQNVYSKLILFLMDTLLTGCLTVVVCILRKILC